MLFSVGMEQTEMDSNYMSLWNDMVQVRTARGRQGAAKGAEFGNQDMSALAWAMLAKGARRLRDMERQAQTSSRTIL
jgi:hypothetical protein